MTRPRRRRTTIGEQFVARPVSTLQSPAYRALSLSAHRVLSRVELEHAHHGGADNGKLPVTYNDFVEYGIDRHAISAAIRECVALGFLEITEQGRAGNAEFRTPNKFRLTYIYSGYPNPTHEWRRVETDEQAAMLAQEARRPIRSARKNRKPVGEKPNSVEEIHTEKCKSIVGKPTLHAKVGKSPLLSIFRVGADLTTGRLTDNAPTTSLRN
jgi:hypothetical protein